MMLSLNNIDTGYEKKQVLFDLSLEVDPGEIVGIIGPNGAGKSTILKAACGLLPVWKGNIRFLDRQITNRKPSQNIRLGLVFAPQGNRVFADMTVLENLEVGGYILSKQHLTERLDKMLQIFPVLKGHLKQQAGSLSGGEQQMLALARALITNPRMILLDEPSLGLAPNLLSTVFEKLVEINQEHGVALLIVEQKVNELLNIAHRVYSLKLGEVAFSGKAEELRGNNEKLRALFL